MDLHPIYPDVLMTTDAVESKIGNPEYRLFEVNLEPEAYAEGHVPGAIHLDWKRQLRNNQTFDILTPEELAELLGQCGVEPHHKIILYGDNNNWFACWAYWLLSMAGHKHVWLMDGGRKKWFEEEREVTTVAPQIERTEYPVFEFDSDSRASIEQVFEAIFSPSTHRLIDVRSAAEFEGDNLGPAGAPVNIVRGGHVRPQ